MSISEPMEMDIIDPIDDNFEEVIDLCGYKNTEFEVSELSPGMAVLREDLYSLAKIDENQTELLNSFYQKLPTFFKDKSLFSGFRVLDLRRVHNVRQKDAFNERSAYYKSCHESTDTATMFYLMPGYDPVFEHDVFLNGLPAGNLPITTHGFPQCGVFLSGNIDSLTFGPNLPGAPMRILICRVVRTPFKYADSFNISYLNQKIPDPTRCVTLFRSNNHGNHGMVHFKDLYFVQDCTEIVNGQAVAADRPKCILPYIIMTCTYGSGVKNYPPYTLPGKNLSTARLVRLNFCGKLLPARLFTRFEGSEEIDEVSIRGIPVQRFTKQTDVATDRIFNRFIAHFLASSKSSFSTHDTMIIADRGVKVSSGFRVRHNMLYPDETGEVLPREDGKALRRIIKYMSREQLMAVCLMPSFTSDIRGPGREKHKEGVLNILVPTCQLTVMLGIPVFEADVLHFLSIREFYHVEGEPLSIKLNEENMIMHPPAHVFDRKEIGRLYRDMLNYYDDSLFPKPRPPKIRQPTNPPHVPVPPMQQIRQNLVMQQIHQQPPAGIQHLPPGHAFAFINTGGPQFVAATPTAPPPPQRFMRPPPPVMNHHQHQPQQHVRGQLSVERIVPISRNSTGPRFSMPGFLTVGPRQGTPMGAPGAVGAYPHLQQHLLPRHGSSPRLTAAQRIPPAPPRATHQPRPQQQVSVPRSSTTEAGMGNTSGATSSDDDIVVLN